MVHSVFRGSQISSRIGIGIGIGIVLLNRERVTLVRERSFVYGSAPGHPIFFFKHSSPLLLTEQLLRTRYMWSFPMIAATGRERRKAPTGRKKARGLGYSGRYSDLRRGGTYI